MPLGYASGDISRAAGNTSSKFRGEINVWVIFIHMVFKTEEWMTDQLERWHWNKKEDLDPNPGAFHKLKGAQKRESQQNTEKEWPVRYKKNQKNVAEAKRRFFKKGGVVGCYQMLLRNCWGRRSNDWIWGRGGHWWLWHNQLQWSVGSKSLVRIISFGRELEMRKWRVIVGNSLDKFCCKWKKRYKTILGKAVISRGGI